MKKLNFYKNKKLKMQIRLQIYNLKQGVVKSKTHFQLIRLK